MEVGADSFPCSSLESYDARVPFQCISRGLEVVGFPSVQVVYIRALMGPLLILLQFVNLTFGHGKFALHFFVIEQQFTRGFG